MRTIVAIAVLFAGVVEAKPRLSAFPKMQPAYTSEFVILTALVSNLGEQASLELWVEGTDERMEYKSSTTVERSGSVRFRLQFSPDYYEQRTLRAQYLDSLDPYMRTDMPPASGFEWNNVVKVEFRLKVGRKYVARTRARVHLSCRECTV